MSLVDILLWSMEGVQESSTGSQEEAGTPWRRTGVGRGAEIEEGRPRARKNLRHPASGCLIPLKRDVMEKHPTVSAFSRFHLLV